MSNKPINPTGYNGVSTDEFDPSTIEPFLKELDEKYKNELQSGQYLMPSKTDDPRIIEIVLCKLVARIQIKGGYLDA